MSILYQPRTRIERRVLFLLLLLSGLSLVIVAILYATNPRSIIGDALVNEPGGQPLEFPPPDISPFFHFKPVTLFFAAFVVFSYASFSLVKPLVPRIPVSLRTVFLTVSVLAVAICVYEVLFNFSLWTVLMERSATINPDQSVNTYPGGILAISLVFATKTFVALLFLSIFAVDCLRISSLQIMPAAESRERLK